MSASTDDTHLEPWLDIVRQRVQGMRFGSVQIVVHEGRVTQVESTEKTRLSSDDQVGSAPPKASRRT